MKEAARSGNAGRAVTVLNNAAKRRSVKKNSGCKADFNAFRG
jgi:hypothetical protein